jgi:arylsulfatase A-like enzyme
MNLEAVEFIERHRDRPFFLYLSHFATHTILRGKEKLVEKYRRRHPPGESSRSRCYICQDAGKEGDPGNHWARDHNPHLAAMLESIDDGVGMIMGKLEELGIAENTIVIFTSDNGGEAPNVTSNAPLRGGKSQLYEGGIREPLIVRWPGAVPASNVCRQPTVNVDFYPTFLEAAGIEPDARQHLDGVSILPVLADPDARLRRDTLYWHYPLERPHFLGGRSSGAIRRGNWKLIEFYDTGGVELYDVVADVGEENDLAEKRPGKVAELRRLLAEWREGVGADRPAQSRPAEE